MTNLEQRFIQLLADPDVDPEEWRQLAKNLETEGLTAYLEQAQKLRVLQRDRSRPVSEPGRVRRGPSRKKGLTKEKMPKPGRESVSQTVSRLLRKEANMTVGEAIGELSTFLETRRPNTRRSFDWQVERLIEEVGGSKVLHAAYRIHGEKTDYVSQSAWPMRR